MDMPIFYYLLMSKILLDEWGNKVSPALYMASGMGLHCSLRLVCPNTYGKYGFELWTLWPFSMSENWFLASSFFSIKYLDETSKMRTSEGYILWLLKDNYSGSPSSLVTCPKCI